MSADKKTETKKEEKKATRCPFGQSAESMKCTEDCELNIKAGSGNEGCAIKIIAQRKK